MSEERPCVRVLKDGDSQDCLRCRRAGMRGKRHKERRLGPWCSGELSPKEAEQRRSKELAREEFRRLVDSFHELCWAGRHEEAIALCRGGTSKLLGYRLREVPR